MVELDNWNINVFNYNVRTFKADYLSFKAERVDKRQSLNQAMIQTIYKEKEKKLKRLMLIFDMKCSFLFRTGKIYIFSIWIPSGSIGTDGSALLYFYWIVKKYLQF